jgi:hypothetical protein
MRVEKREFNMRVFSTLMPQVKREQELMRVEKREFDVRVFLTLMSIDTKFEPT